MAIISRRYQRIILISIVFSSLVYLSYTFFEPVPLSAEPPFHEQASSTPQEDDDNTYRYSKETPQSDQKELVVASLVGDETDWLDQYFGNWTKNIYIVNNQSAPLTVAVNKGREAMPFLTYIITRYATLPDVSIFIHSKRYQWHNEDPMYDGVPVLQMLRLPQVQKKGYVALRCSWTMGCPAELHPLHPSDGSDDRSQNERAYAKAFRFLLPDEPIPEIVGAHCSSQFAVSRDRIHARPLAHYEKIQRWLLETDLDDQISGRVIEYMWHIIFGMPGVDCQDTGECFCETFGLCNLTCTRGACEKRYQLPQYATIPQGWPEVGPGQDGWPAKGWAD
ncbi:hypothetical protein P154DRAFT_527629 [Amniculicola lignicola CBS 123094]|uniref:Uncharacterized protein n=1 Tax=Amniculicola lignicola CBS 123094 TaxID=1392246 RepID=A0A6A5VY52_9PLEO|nr:hypothetical protein P154DRAFT_527629 [Amniculicola lignicola CBS 123094]